MPPRPNVARTKDGQHEDEARAVRGFECPPHYPDVVERGEDSPRQKQH
jgi:hypothetical protein